MHRLSFWSIYIYFLKPNTSGFLRYKDLPKSTKGNINHDRVESRKLGTDVEKNPVVKNKLTKVRKTPIKQKPQNKSIDTIHKPRNTLLSSKKDSWLNNQNKNPQKKGVKLQNQKDLQDPEPSNKREVKLKT